MHPAKATAAARRRRQATFVLSLLLVCSLFGALGSLFNGGASASPEPIANAAPAVQTVAAQAQLPAVAASAAQGAMTAAANVQAAAPGTCAAKVTVKPGDTLAKLVKANGRPDQWAAVAREGNFNPHVIKVGQEICMHWNGTPPAAAPEPQAPAAPQQQAAPASGWVHPLGQPTVCTSRFGPRVLNGASDNHRGTDLRARYVPLRSMASGVVLPETGKASGYGNVIVIKHNDGTTVEYGHLYKIGVADGQRVSAGQIIGVTGNSGQSTAPHLHITVTTGAPFVDAHRVSPERTLARHGVQLCAGDGKD